MSVSQAPSRIKGYAIVSEDGMLANSARKMPDSLKFKADQDFFERGLDRVDVRWPRAAFVGEATTLGSAAAVDSDS